EKRRDRGARAYPTGSVTRRCAVHLDRKAVVGAEDRLDARPEERERQVERQIRRVGPSLLIEMEEEEGIGRARLDLEVRGAGLRLGALGRVLLREQPTSGERH